MQEIWKAITGLESQYEVSTMGRVRNIVTGRLLTGWLSNGYRRVVLRCPTAKKGKIEAAIHRLVAVAFIPNPEGKPEVDHKNGIRDDNRVENLHWVTHLENVRNPVTAAIHAARIRETHKTPEFRAKLRAIHLDPGFKERTAKSYGAAHARARGRQVPTLQKAVRCIETGEEWPSVKACAEATGNTSATITKSCKRRLSGSHMNKTAKGIACVRHYEYVYKPT